MRHLLATTLLFSCGAAALAAPQSPTDPLRDTVRGAITWIGTQAVPVPEVEGAVLFPASEGSKQPPQSLVYGGTAGVLIFLENAAAVLDSKEARELADRTAKGLRSQRHQDDHERVSWSKGGSMGVTGLYTGDAGVGQAFLVRHLLRNDAEALATAVEIGDALLARGREDGDTLAWDDQADIIFGNAGTALFLLELGIAAKAERFTTAARRAGHGLVGEALLVPSSADPAQKLPTWMFHMGSREVHMPNFSHGTAGVAYALVRIGAATGDAKLLQAGRDGAQWMIENAVADGEGLKWAARAGAQATYMGGWCHGPAGTGRLFLLLAAVTGEARYREIAAKGAKYVIAYADQAAKKTADGKQPYVPPSLCCGVAGVVDFFCDLARVTKDPAHVAFAKKAGDYLIEVAVADGAGRKWKNGQSVPGGPVASNSSGFNVDLMLGAAGEALALLRLITLDREQDPVRSLPDRAVGAAK